MADVFLGSVYAKLELREGDLGASVNAAKRSLNGLDASMSNSAGVAQTSGAKMGAAFGAVAGVVQSLTTKAFDALSASIGGGIARFDILRNYPKIMQNLGYSAKESAASIQKLSDNALGLPTALEDLATTTKALTPFSRSLDEATVMASALNDAFLAAGASTADTKRGLIQYTQMLSKGKVDMAAWNTLQETMGSSLQQVAKKFGIASGNTIELYDQLKEGKISFQQFGDAIMELDKKGLKGFKSFRDQAFDATGGVQTSIDNLKNAFNRFWANLIDTVGAENIQRVLGAIGKSVESMGKTIGNVLKVAMPYIERFANFLIDHGPIVEKVILGVVGGLIAFKTIKGVVGILSPFASALGSIGKAGKSIAPLTGKAGGGLGSFVAGALKPLGDPKVLLGAASVVVISVGLIGMAYAFNQIAGMKVNLKNLGIMALAVPIAAGIFALVGLFGIYAAVGGIATAIIGGGLAALAAGLSYASGEAQNIKFGEIMKLSGILVVVSAIMAGIASWAVYGAIGAVASAVIGGGLLLAAMSLAKVGQYVPQIRMGDIAKFSGMLGVVSLILGSISGLAVFGAVGAVATAIIGGGLLLTAMSLVKVSKLIPKIKEKDIMKFSVTLAVVSTVLGLVAGFAAFGAVTSVASTIIAGGLWLTAFELVKVSELLPKIREKDLVKFSATIAIVSGILSAVALLSPFSTIGAIVTSVITGGILIAARQLLVASAYAKALKPSDIDHLTEILKKIAEWDSGSMFKSLKNMVNSTTLAVTATMVRDVAQKLSTTPIVPTEAIESIKKNLKSFAELETGGVMGNLSKMWSSGMLTKTADNAKEIINTLASVKPLSTEAIDGLKKNMKSLSELETSGVMKSLNDMWASGNLQKVAENIKKIVNDLTGLKPPNNDTINAIKTAITNLSNIEITGNGLFQNKGKDAEQLALIVSKIREMANNLSGMPTIDYGTVVGFVSAIKVFDRIDDNAKNGLRRMSEMKDSLGNINWIKFILGDIPEGLQPKAVGLVSAIKVFDRIDDNARNGAMRLASMRDSLGNIDWVKKILGDVPADLPAKAQALVDAINKLGSINFDSGKLRGIGANLISNLVAGINSGLGSVTAAASAVQSAVWQALNAKMGDQRTLGSNMTSRFVDGLRSNFGSVSQAGRDTQGALWRAIQAKMQDEYYQGAAMMGRFVSGLNSKGGEAYSSGANAAQGFINGANSKNAYSTGWNIASQFLSGLKAKGKEGSPWKTTFQSGAWAGEGFANGILKSESQVLKAANVIADSVMDTMNLDKMGNMMVTPNMAEMNSSVRSLSSTIDMKEIDRPNEVSIYGGLTVNAGNRDGESILDELARATMLRDKGMATAL